MLKILIGIKSARGIKKNALRNHSQWLLGNCITDRKLTKLIEKKASYTVVLEEGRKNYHFPLLGILLLLERGNNERSEDVFYWDLSQGTATKQSGR